MREALEEVKRAFGPDAVILGTRSVPPGALGRLVGRNLVEITAAPPETPTPAPRLKPTTAAASAQGVSVQSEPRPQGRGQHPNPVPQGRGQTADLRREFGAEPDIQACYVQLVQNEVAQDLAARLVREAAEAVERTGKRSKIDSPEENAQALQGALRRYIARMVPATGGIELTEGKTRRVALVGPPGGGKTTTLAKLAAHFKLRRGKSVVVLSLDTQRMGAGEQLRRYAEVLAIPFFCAQTVIGVKETLEKIGTPDLLLIDTPGVSWREQGRFVRLAALLRAARPDETHLVLPVSLAAAVQERAAKLFAPFGVSRVALTRLDEAVGLGTILNLVKTLQCELSYLSSGQNVPQDIQEACGERVAELILAPSS